jgi:hypothetical protein
LDRDPRHDVAAEIIGIRPLRTKLLAFLSSFYRGIAGAVRGPSSNLYERGRGQRLKDRALVPNIGAKAGIESGGPDDRKSAFF